MNTVKLFREVRNENWINSIARPKPTETRCSLFSIERRIGKMAFKHRLPSGHPDSLRKQPVAPGNLASGRGKSGQIRNDKSARSGNVHPKRHPATPFRHSPVRRVMRDLRSDALENCRGYSCSYLPIIRMVNEPGTAAPWGPRPPPGGGGGAGPRSWLIVKMWFVWLSNVIVRAPFIV